jgi:hypothetical protein
MSKSYAVTQTNTAHELLEKMIYAPNTQECQHIAASNTFNHLATFQRMTEDSPQAMVKE